MSSHVMGVFLDELLMIQYMAIVIIFGYDDGCLSTLIMSIGMKSRRCLSLCFAYISNLRFFPKSVVNCNHRSGFFLMLIKWL